MSQMSGELTESFCTEGLAGGGVLADFSHVPLLFASTDMVRRRNTAQGRGYRLLILSNYYPVFLLYLPLAVRSDSKAFTCL